MTVPAASRLFRPAVAPPDADPPPERTLWFVFRERELLVDEAFEPPRGEPLAEHGFAARAVHYLGCLGELHCCAAELPADAAAPAGHRFVGLRQLFGRLDEGVHGVAGRAVQIVDWDRSHRFCGACGAPTEPAGEERVRTCPRCGLACFPRLTPAVIMTVERGDTLLLGRSPRFPPGIYSVLAGFVEPGESCEEAVAREVLEETGVEVEDVRYFASQPWPFPNSLMLGFTARHRAGEIRVDGVEIEDAGWFRADEMPRTFPGRVSISQWLIEDWLARQR